jgi:hypothetical protein
LIDESGAQQCAPFLHGAIRQKLLAMSGARHES